MSADLQAIVEALQFNNYTSVVVVTVVVYDYIMTFPKEIKYIWNRSWTFVSAMFILVRYIGLAAVLIYGLYGSTALFLVAMWAFVIFLAAADIVMILRVYAMYNRSRIVLGVLLVLYAVTIILYVVSAAYYTNPHTLSMTTPQVLNMSFCNPTTTTSIKLGVYKLIPRLILAALMLILVVVRFCAESFQTYKATRQWKVNRYLNLLVKEGVFYFVIHFLYCVDFGQKVAGFVMDMFTYILVFILAPRFIMNVRELHQRNVTFGPDMGTDSAFGFSSRIPGVSSIGFADSGTLGITEGDLEMVGSNTDSEH